MRLKYIFLSLSINRLNIYLYIIKLHFVNWNPAAYQTPKNAVNSKKHDGIVVLGVLIKV